MPHFHHQWHTVRHKARWYDDDDDAAAIADDVVELTAIYVAYVGSYSLTAAAKHPSCPHICRKTYTYRLNNIWTDINFAHIDDESISGKRKYALNVQLFINQIARELHVAATKTITERIVRRR